MPKTKKILKRIKSPSSKPPTAVCTWKCHWTLKRIWLTQKQNTQLFEKDRSVITKHVNNIFKEKDPSRKAICAKFAHIAEDGKTFETQFYNLDVIISVGYRLKSQRGVQIQPNKS